MVCEAIQEQLELGGALDAVARQHVAGCAACTAAARTQAQLQAVMRLDEDQPVAPGFDTRFFARLREQRAPRRGFLWRIGLVGAVAAAAVAFVVLVGRGGPGLEDPTEIELAMNLEMIDDLDVVQHLDEAEAFELLAHVDVGELDAAQEGAVP